MSAGELDFGAFWEEVGGPDADAWPDWMRDLQPRARRTREAILRTTWRLLHEQSYSDVTLREIADETGISVGAVYARFPSKEAILVVLGLVAFSASVRAFASAMDALPSEAGLDEVIAAYVGTLVAELHRHRALILEIRLRSADEPELRALLDRTNRRVHQAFLARALAAGTGTSATERALRYGLFMTNAAAREAILAGALGVYNLPADLSELAGELSRSFAAYLRSG